MLKMSLEISRMATLRDAREGSFFIDVWLEHDRPMDQEAGDCALCLRRHISWWHRVADTM